MPIGGVESVLYGVADLTASTQFYDDFGLKAISRRDDEVVYRLEEGSRVILRAIDDPGLPPHHYQGSGIRETFFGIDSREELDAYAERLATDRDVRRSNDGNTIHFVAEGGMPIGLTVWTRKKVLYAPDPVNAPDNVKRLNQHRRWRVRAAPKTINHVVWRVPDIHACLAFFRDRLDFRVTDYQIDTGIFVRSENANQHHVIYLQKWDRLPLHNVGFDHICFGVEDIDEVFAGSNYMDRRGYRNPLSGPGRHRVASALYCYFDAPCGGMAEYGADTDYLDDSWVPRVWEGRFGAFMWTHRIFPFLPEEVEWNVTFDTGTLPTGLIPGKFSYPPETAKSAYDQPLRGAPDGG
jgi:catechol-2,3-dioxygenase